MADDSESGLGPKETILLVDDERDSLEPMRVMLEGDYAVLTAQDGPQALALLERERVEMIIADQRMPGMTGVELLSRVWQFDPDIVRLILTAYTDFDAMLKAINEGRVYRYIIKPWDVDDMRLTISQALEWRQLLITKGQLAADLSEAHKALAQRTRELEQAQDTLVRQEKLAAVGQFAAEMVHEMNNYLTIISGLSTTVSDHLNEGLNDIAQIGVQARTLAEVAADIRDFSLGAAMPFSPMLDDPAGIAREVIRICEHHPDFRNQEISLQLGSISSWKLDNRQLKHLLINLMKNSAQAQPKRGMIILAVGVEQDELVFRISDRGPGISADALERIWEPFFTTREHTGSGLGLSICKKVAIAHSGSISVEQTPGGGATFIARFPRVPE